MSVETPRLLMHSHSRWEDCNKRCPIWWKFEQRMKAHYPDSDKKDIVINGVAFKP